MGSGDHGPLTDLSAVADSIAMIRATRAIVAERLGEGMSAAAIAEEGLGEAWPSYGAGFINEARWIQILLTDFQ